MHNTDGGGVIEAIFDGKAYRMEKRGKTKAYDNKWGKAGWQDVANERIWQIIF